MRIYDVINGWTNYLVDDPTSNETALKRWESCAHCEMRKFGKVLAVLKDYSINEVTGNYCKECGCPLVAKLRSKTNKCPLNKW